jgi:hypothetical protein
MPAAAVKLQASASTCTLDTGRDPMILASAIGILAPPELLLPCSSLLDRARGW